MRFSEGIGLEGAHALLGQIAGVVLLVAVPILSAASFLVRRRHPRWEAETPEGVLRYALKRLDVVAALLRLACWHAYVLAGFVAVLWVCAGLGLIARDEVLALASVLYLGVAAATLLWVRWRRRILARERARCEGMLGEYG